MGNNGYWLADKFSVPGLLWWCGLSYKLFIPGSLWFLNVHEEAMGGQKSDFTLKLVDHQKPLYHAKTD